MKLRMYFSTFGLLFGGLMLVRVFAAVIWGLADGGAVLPRILDFPGLLIHLISSLLMAGVWCLDTLRRGH